MQRIVIVLPFDRKIVANDGLRRCRSGGGHRVQMLLLDADAAIHAAQLRCGGFNWNGLGLAIENHTHLPDANHNPHTPSMRWELVENMS